MIKTCIPIGSLCFQDFNVFIWPRKTDNPETIFDGKKVKDFFYLEAPGYGQRGDYGNGAIHIKCVHFGAN